MKKIFIPTAENVKVLGRTVMLEDCRLLCASGSGVEFTYTGTRLAVTFLGDSSAKSEGSIVNWRDIPRVQVTVDGLVMLDTTIKKEEETFVVYGEDPATPVGEHTVRIIKLSEPRMSSVGLGQIEIEASSGPLPTADKDKFVEFIGDSITCGYGVDTDNELCPFSTGTENAAKAYAYLAAKMLDVDYSLVSYSGHGLLSGWTADPNVAQKEELIQPYYEITAYSYNNFRGISPQNVKWEFEREPDVVVINLGTNDYSYTQDDPGKVAEYEKCYIDFLSQVRNRNPKAHIICALGVMGDELCPAIERAVAGYEDKCGDKNVSTLKFTPQNPDIDGYVSDYHPSASTHKKTAEVMAEQLRKRLW